VIAALVLLAAVPSPAPASARWGPIAVAVPGGQGPLRTPLAAGLDDRRNALLILLEGTDAPPAPGPAPVRLLVTHGRPGGAFTTPQPLVDGYAQAELASNAAGDVVALWHKDTACHDLLFCNQDLWLATGSVADGLDAPVHLTAKMFNGDHPALALDPRGDALVAWAEFDPPARQTSLHVIQRRGRAAFGADQIVQTSRPFSPSAGMDSDGDALLAWREQVDLRQQVAAMWVDPSGRLGAVHTVDSATSTKEQWVTSGPSVAVVPGGGAMIGWSARRGGGARQGPTRLASAAPQRAFRRLADQPEGFEALVAGPRGGFATFVADGHGTATTESPRFELLSAYAGLRRFGRPAPVAKRTTRSGHIAVDAGGDTLVSWAAAGRARVSVRPRGRPFGRPFAVGGHNGFGAAVLSVNHRGDALAAFTVESRSTPDVAVRLRRR
jgi:hypothetical protein